MKHIVRSSRLTVAALAVTAGLAMAPAFAHHSFAQYDQTKVSEVEGTVQKFEWSNPHSWLFIRVPSESGAEVTYGFELQSVGELLRRGWTKTIVKPGDKVKVAFRAMRDGTPAGLMQTVWDASGKPIGRQMGDAPAPAAPAAAKRD